MHGIGNITGPSERVNRIGLAAGLLALLLFKAWLLVDIELGKDEAAYWYWARHHLDASYAFGLLAMIRVADLVWPGVDLILRLPFIVGGLASAWFLHSACVRAGLEPRDRILAVAAFVTSHWAWHTGSFLHPDGVLVPVWLATLAMAQRADRSGLDRDWTLTGVLAGIAALSKYSGCVLAAGLVLALVLRRDRGVRPLFLCAVPCAVVASPLLIALWELDFHLPFTLGSLSQVAADRHIIWRAGLFLLAPLLYVSPPLLVLLYAGVPRAWKRRTEDGVDLLVAPALSLLGTFAFFALYNGQVKGNWILPAFLGLWPFAFQALHNRRRRRLWWAAILLVGAGQAAIPAATLRWPGLAQTLVASSPEMVDNTYPSIVSPTDLPREPTFSWTERVCEYHGWQEFGRLLEAHLQSERITAGAVSSGEYGVAFGLGRYMPSAPDVTVTQDERFAHIADVAQAQATVYVTRAGSVLPPTVSRGQAGTVARLERNHGGCGPVLYDVFLLAAEPAPPLPK